MPRLSTHPWLPYLSTIFSTIFLGFGATYMVYPRVGYSLFGFSTSPTSAADAELMDRIMVLYGAKDVFLAISIFVSTWYGTSKSAGMILMAASACAGVDGYVVGRQAGTGEWNHWGYGTVMGLLGCAMSGLLG